MTEISFVRDQAIQGDTDYRVHRPPTIRNLMHPLIRAAAEYQHETGMDGKLDIIAVPNQDGKTVTIQITLQYTGEILATIDAVPIYHAPECRTRNEEPSEWQARKDAQLEAGSLDGNFGLVDTP